MTLDVPAGWAVGVVTGALLLAGALLSASPRGRSRAPVAALLLCVAASAASAALHGADLRRGPVPAAARHYATVTAEVEVTGDPASPGRASGATGRCRPRCSSRPRCGG